MSPDPSIDRRGFLAGATAAACTTGLTGASVAVASSPSPSALYDLTCDDFANLVGSSFRVAGTDHQQAPAETKLVLREAKSYAHPSDKLRPSHVRPAGFSLLFEAPSDLRLADGMHLVSGAGFSGCQVLLDSHVDDRFPHRRLYEAVFN